MNAFLSYAPQTPSSGLPPVLIVASSDAAMARATIGVEASGYRVGASLPLEGALKRIELQAAATAIWIEVDRDCGDPMDELLARVSGDVAEGRYAAVVSATGALVDPLAAQLTCDAIEFVIDGNEAERAAALSIAATRHGVASRIWDVANDRNAERLRQLSEEVSRIASTLARLSTGPIPGPRLLEPVPQADLAYLSAETVRGVIRARQLRARYFSQELFADPAWDMLLDLLQAEIAQLRVPVSSVCIAAAVPATTALRWLKMMVAEGLFIRRADPHDGRRVFVELAPETSNGLRRYFADVGQVAVI